MAAAAASWSAAVRPPLTMAIVLAAAAASSYIAFARPAQAREVRVRAASLLQRREATFQLLLVSACCGLFAYTNFNRAFPVRGLGGCVACVRWLRRVGPCP